MPSVSALASISMRRTSGWTNRVSAFSCGSLAPVSARPWRRSCAYCDCVLIGSLGHGEPLQPDAEPRRVHHDEHRGEALHLLADQPAGRAVIVHHAGRIGVDAHLVLDRPARHRVALAERPVVIDEELRHHEQRDALRAVRRARRLGQHEMDDVLGQVMLARRDEDLGAGDRIAAVRAAARRGCGSGRDRCRIAARSGSSCPPHSPETILGTYFVFCSSVPFTSKAAIAPWVSPGYMANAMFDEIIYSWNAVETTCGIPARRTRTAPRACPSPIRRTCRRLP